MPEEMPRTEGHGKDRDQTQDAGPFPLTIAEWRAAQLLADGQSRLLSLVKHAALVSPIAWISMATPEHIMEQWAFLEAKRGNAANMPLWGVPFAVKDNIDAAGFRTTAGCPAFAGSVVTEDSPVVAKLKDAGAVVIGKTNLDQFATGLVGTRSPYGAVPNSFDQSRVSGGSSSGSAVVVSGGFVPFSLGTDTAGSGRVPAGLNNIFGLKPTRGALSIRGVIPACKTLDCVSIFALTIDDASEVLRVIEGFDAQDPYSRKRPADSANMGYGYGIAAAICRNPPWFGEVEQQQAYLVALEKARALDWKLVETDFSLLFDLAKLLYEGPWVAERYEAIRSFLEGSSAEEMDPVVHGIILKGREFSAADAFASEYRRRELSRQIEEAFSQYDAILVPTTPTFPTIEDVGREPIARNSTLGTYTNFVNFMEWAALSVPAGFRSDDLPFGITFIAGQWKEPLLLHLGRQWVAGESRPLGATGRKHVEPAPAPLNLAPALQTTVSLVVVGAHLSGFPLNKDLVSRGATFELATTTSPHYQLFSLEPKNGIKKPGLKRVAEHEQGRAIDVEVWALPVDQLWSFMSTIPHPLGLGSVELKDQAWRLGFICEPVGLLNATEITHFGGWRAYMTQPPKVPQVMQ
ncbi:allophanate hydrolase [Thozetella sp. PMI_491]|nr:allophanate hydrolase [Thozetella sp. PMI_491]